MCRDIEPGFGRASSMRI